MVGTGDRMESLWGALLTTATDVPVRFGLAQGRVSRRPAAGVSVADLRGALRVGAQGRVKGKAIVVLESAGRRFQVTVRGESVVREGAEVTLGEVPAGSPSRRLRLVVRIDRVHD